MDLKSVIRACCVLLCVVGRGSVAAPLPQFTDTDFEPSSKETVQSKKSFQRSLSGLYSIESWQEQQSLNLILSLACFTLLLPMLKLN
ncbi:hypothetical protein [Photobacterium sanguinicancri]|uniref:hypothetical protein n=1 Tax=Photobacterium sanguinicancri TaxID=875932 RepID=UPI000A9C8CCE